MNPQSNPASPHQAAHVPDPAKRGRTAALLISMFIAAALIPLFPVLAPFVLTCALGVTFAANASSKKFSDHILLFLKIVIPFVLGAAIALVIAKPLGISGNYVAAAFLVSIVVGFVLGIAIKHRHGASTQTLYCTAAFFIIVLLDIASIAIPAYGSVGEAADKLVRVTETISPDPDIAARYETQYQRFRAIYPAVKALFPKLNG